MTNTKLMVLENEWEKEFKGSLLEIIGDDMKEYGLTLKEELINLVNEIFPIWLEEWDEKESLNNYKSRIELIISEL